MANHSEISNSNFGSTFRYVGADERLGGKLDEWGFNGMESNFILDNPKVSIKECLLTWVRGQVKEHNIEMKDFLQW